VVWVGIDGGWLHVHLDGHYTILGSGLPLDLDAMLTAV
jgi:hypothetical protein